MSENIYYSEGSVQVTNARLMIGGQTYAMPNITSVRTDVTPGVSRGFLVFLGLACLFVLLVLTVALAAVGTTVLLSVLLGLACFGGIFAIAKTSKPTYALTVATSAREVQALTSKNEQEIKDIVAAINEAIVQRYDGVTRPQQRRVKRPVRV